MSRVDIVLTPEQLALLEPFFAEAQAADRAGERGCVLAQAFSEREPHDGEGDARCLPGQMRVAFIAHEPTVAIQAVLRIAARLKRAEAVKP